MFSSFRNFGERINSSLQDLETSIQQQQQKRLEQQQKEREKQQAQYEAQQKRLQYLREGRAKESISSIDSVASASGSAGSDVGFEVEDMQGNDTDPPGGSTLPPIAETPRLSEDSMATSSETFTLAPSDTPRTSTTSTNSTASNDSSSSRPSTPTQRPNVRSIGGEMNRSQNDEAKAESASGQGESEGEDYGERKGKQVLGQGPSGNEALPGTATQTLPPLPMPPNVSEVVVTEQLTPTAEGEDTSSVPTPQPSPSFRNADPLGGLIATTAAVPASPSRGRSVSPQPKPLPPISSPPTSPSLRKKYGILETAQPAAAAEQTDSLTASSSSSSPIPPPSPIPLPRPPSFPLTSSPQASSTGISLTPTPESIPSALRQSSVTSDNGANQNPNAFSSFTSILSAAPSPPTITAPLFNNTNAGHHRPPPLALTLPPPTSAPPSTPPQPSSPSTPDLAEFVDLSGAAQAASQFAGNAFQGLKKGWSRGTGRMGSLSSLEGLKKWGSSDSLNLGIPTGSLGGEAGTHIPAIPPIVGVGGVPPPISTTGGLMAMKAGDNDGGISPGPTTAPPAPGGGAGHRNTPPFPQVSYAVRTRPGSTTPGGTGSVPSSPLLRSASFSASTGTGLGSAAGSGTKFPPGLSRSETVTGATGIGSGGSVPMHSRTSLGGADVWLNTQSATVGAATGTSTGSSKGGVSPLLGPGSLRSPSPLNPRFEASPRLPSDKSDKASIANDDDDVPLAVGIRKTRPSSLDVNAGRPLSAIGGSSGFLSPSLSSAADERFALEVDSEPNTPEKGNSRAETPNLGQTKSSNEEESNAEEVASNEDENQDKQSSSSTIPTDSASSDQTSSQPSISISTAAAFPPSTSPHLSNPSPLPSIAEADSPGISPIVQQAEALNDSRTDTGANALGLTTPEGSRPALLEKAFDLTPVPQPGVALAAPSPDTDHISAVSPESNMQMGGEKPEDEVKTEGEGEENKKAKENDLTRSEIPLRLPRSEETVVVDEALEEKNEEDGKMSVESAKRSSEAPPPVAIPSTPAEPTTPNPFSPATGDGTIRISAVLRALDRPVDGMDDVEIVEGFLRNLKSRVDISADEIARSNQQLQQQHERFEELREMHRLEVNSMTEELEALRRDFSNQGDNAARAYAELEETKSSLEKAQFTAKEEEEKRVKSVNLLKGVRQKLLQTEKEKEELHKERDNLSVEKTNRENDFLNMRAEKETQVSRLKQAFDRETDELKRQYDRQWQALKSQSELEIITLKSAHSRELKEKNTKIREMEDELKRSRQDVGNLLEDSAKRHAEIETARQEKESESEVKKEIEFQLREMTDRVNELESELEEHRHSSSSRVDSDSQAMLTVLRQRHEETIRSLQDRLTASEKDRRKDEEEMARNLRQRFDEIEKMRVELRRKDSEYEESVKGKRERDELVRLAERDKRKMEEKLKGIQQVMEDMRQETERAVETEAETRVEMQAQMQRITSLQGRLEEAEALHQQLRQSNKSMRDELRKAQSFVLMSEKERNPGVGYFANFSNGSPATRSRGSLPQDSVTSLDSTSPEPPDRRASGTTSPSNNGKRSAGSDEAINFEYLRNVVMQFLEKKEMRPHLVSVLGTVLHFTPQETRKLAAKVASG